MPLKLKKRKNLLKRYNFHLKCLPQNGKHFLYKKRKCIFHLPAKKHLTFVAKYDKITMLQRNGALAQLGAHNTGSVGVTGSNPVRSTKKHCRKGYVFCSVFLSKSQTWYIITARSVVDIISPLGCISSRISVYLSAT